MIKFVVVADGRAEAFKLWNRSDHVDHLHHERGEQVDIQPLFFYVNFQSKSFGSLSKQGNNLLGVMMNMSYKHCVNSKHGFMH